MRHKILNQILKDEMLGLDLFRSVSETKRET